MFGPPPEGGAPAGPGPFDLADPHILLDLLSRAGFGDVRVEPMAYEVVLPDAEALAEVLSDLGPGAARLRQAGGGSEGRAALVAAMREALAPYVSAGALRMPALANIAVGVRP